jgi:hypothetical protein
LRFAYLRGSDREMRFHIGQINRKRLVGAGD